MRSSVAGSSGVWLAALAGLLLAVPISAQTYASLTEDMREREFNHVRQSILTVARQMPADLYDFRAAPEIRSFGEEINHAADVNFRLCRLASTGTEEEGGNERAGRAARSPTGNAELIARLRESLELCAESLRTLTDAEALEPTFGPYIKGSHVVAMPGSYLERLWQAHDHDATERDRAHGWIMLVVCRRGLLDRTVAFHKVLLSLADVTRAGSV